MAQVHLEFVDFVFNANTIHGKNVLEKKIIDRLKYTMDVFHKK